MGFRTFAHARYVDEAILACADITANAINAVFRCLIARDILLAFVNIGNKHSLNIIFKIVSL